jgi:hypothetical protein
VHLLPLDFLDFDVILMSSITYIVGCFLDYASDQSRSVMGRYSTLDSTFFLLGDPFWFSCVLIDERSF